MTPNKPEVERLAQCLRRVPLPIKAAALFGSYARGEHVADSDMDILVASEELSAKRQRRGKEAALIKQYCPLGTPLDVLLLTPDECSANFRNHNPLFLDIASEGLIVFDTDNLLHDLFEQTRTHIREKNIRKIPDGWLFPVLFREPSYLSPTSNKDFALVMLQDAMRDHDIGGLLAKAGYYDKGVYHFQQATEKALKAALVCLGAFKKSHFVAQSLLEIAEAAEIPEDQRKKLIDAGTVALEIEPEVTWSRYPGLIDDSLWVPAMEYGPDDAAEAGRRAFTVLSLSREFVSWWFE